MTNSNELTNWIVRTVGKSQTHEFTMVGTRADVVLQAKMIVATRPDLIVTYFRAVA